MRKTAAVLAAGGLLVALCVTVGKDALSGGSSNALLQRPSGVQSLSNILGVDTQGRRAIETLIAKTEQSWQVLDAGRAELSCYQGGDGVAFRRQAHTVPAL